MSYLDQITIGSTTYDIQDSNAIANPSTKSDGQVLVYDYLLDKWVAATFSGGGGLPDVSSTDNGKVLKVINGAWDIGTDSTGLTDPGTLPSLTLLVSSETLSFSWDSGTLPS